MKTKVLSASDPFALPHALDILKNGGLVAFPTDTVYGLGALAFDPASVDRLYVMKGRSHDKAIAILISHPDELSKVAGELKNYAQKLATAFWPGPLTLVVPRHPRVPDNISPLPTVGVRVPDHIFALKLLTETGPMAVTSANLSGKQNTTTAKEVLDQLAGRVHLIIDGGRTPGGVPSTVVDCTQAEPVVLRPGPISVKQIQNALE